MGQANLNVHCRFCDDRHRPRFLCDPAKRVLDAMLDRGMSFNLPTLEFPEPLPGIEGQLGLNPDDQLASQIVAKAAVLPFAGTFKPALILTGRAGDRVLPQWLYAGNDDDLRRLTTLVGDITEMAIRRAAQARTEGRIGHA